MVVSLQNIKSALQDRKILANNRERKFALVIIPETRIIGEPDIIDCSNGLEPVIIDIKTTRRLPNEPWLDNKLQMAVYVMGMRRLGFKSSYGVLKYQLVDDNSQTREFRIEVDDVLKQYLVDAVRNVSRIINGGEPVLTNNKKKCISCGYRNSCRWSLAKN
jgi:CRISPR/Cas system-associated exonuclease Cas4 (RecB family)